MAKEVGFLSFPLTKIHIYEQQAHGGLTADIVTLYTLLLTILYTYIYLYKIHNTSIFILHLCLLPFQISSLLYSTDQSTTSSGASSNANDSLLLGWHLSPMHTQCCSATPACTAALSSARGHGQGPRLLCSVGAGAVGW